MDTDEPVYKGFLLLPPTGKILKKGWQRKYCVLYKRSSSGVGRIEIYENEAITGQAKIITLEDVIKITPKGKVINIVTKHVDVEFAALSEENLDIWFGALKSVAFPDESGWINSIEQDNDLYCPADAGVFLVKLHPSEASQRCNLTSKNYILEIATAALQLRDDVENKLLFTWPFSYIRKYGYKGGRFTFEAGRKCASGEGVFYLEHKNHNEIYRCLSTKMKNMKKILNGESTSSLIDCGEQLHAAWSMEAGSRNPLPLSLSTQSLDSTSKASLYFPSSVSSVETIGKIVPKKPPRKSVPFKNVTEEIARPVITLNAKHEYADVQIIETDVKKYDTVESREAAWKTLGLENPPHSEPIHFGSDENFYCSWGQPLRKTVSELKLTQPSFNPYGNKSIEDLNVLEDNDHSISTINNLTKSVNDLLISTKHAPTVISEPIQSSKGQGYYLLNFFGGQPSGIISPNYKQVISTTHVPVDGAVNHYEEVNIMEPARSADDSYLGYAQVKRNIPNDKLKENPILEDVKKENLYASVSKPKRV